MRRAAAMLADLADIGRDTRLGGYSRPVFGGAEHELREWFAAEATARGLGVETDPNGILWAWWGDPGPGAVITGSHLDSVPGGGPHDGPLGVVSALLAVDRMRATGHVPQVPFAIAVFPEEEGSRFGVACLGSRLLSGSISPERALSLKDADGLTAAEAYRSAGLDPERVGPEPRRLGQVRRFVELHIEQGLGQATLGAPVAVAESIISHGRWRISFRGQGNHAGTTAMADRTDPVVAAARTVVDVQVIATARPDARATVGRLQPVPGGTNVIASRVDMWLDVRHPREEVTAELVEAIRAAAEGNAALEGCSAELVEESLSPTVRFQPALQRRMKELLGGDVPTLATGAGHDAGVLSADVETGMLFVRNPTGVSHAPEESVEDDDAEAGVKALATVLAELTRGSEERQIR
ncbi:allantoate amidohydrolase [Kocuria marina]|uniref:allantoate amidohydrolase n=1 Tax=Kocuria marina TaxID=223184 RepID=UPI0039AED3A5